MTSPDRLIACHYCGRLSPGEVDPLAQEVATGVGKSETTDRNDEATSPADSEPIAVDKQKLPTPVAPGCYDLCMTPVVPGYCKLCNGKCKVPYYYHAESW